VIEITSGFRTLLLFSSYEAMLYWMVRRQSHLGIIL
jgi:hypothetical protein